MDSYSSINAPSTFAKRATIERAHSLDARVAANTWVKTASHWKRPHLFACRLICKKEEKALPMLKLLLNSAILEQVAEIQRLHNGPKETVAKLATMSEVRISHEYRSDCLGYVWAALAPLLPKPLPPHSMTLRHKRDEASRAPANDPDSLPFSALSLAEKEQSQSEGSDSRPSSSSSASEPLSIGYTEALRQTLVEDYTVRFAASFIRSVLNYGQSPGDKSQVLFRDERYSYKVELEKDKHWLEAIDDGGLQLIDDTGKSRHVALLEAKRTFRVTAEHKPDVSDELLAQTFAEALGVHLNGVQELVSKNDVIIIVAVRHYFKFLHFRLSTEHINGFKKRNPAEVASENTYAWLNSTNWLDATEPGHRQRIIQHILALVSWAKKH